MGTSPSFDRSWMSHTYVLPQHLDREVFVGCLYCHIDHWSSESLQDVEQSHVIPGLVQMSEEELGGWYPWWSHILCGYWVLKTTCRQKPCVINSSFEKLTNGHNVRSLCDFVFEVSCFMVICLYACATDSNA